MKKIYSLILFLTINILCFGQDTLLTEYFTTYDGTTGTTGAATTPVGWTISSHGSYSSTGGTGYTGVSGPNSYKFGITNATITTPVFSSADSVKFWLKGAGISPSNFLYILESADGLIWDTLAKMNPLPSSGTAYTFPVKSTSIQLRFTYLKVAGNLAFDDFVLIKNPAINADFSFVTACANDTVPFTDLSFSNNGTINSWLWNFGNGKTSTLQNPKVTFANDWVYNVKLVVGDDLGNKDSITIPVNIRSTPIAGFTSSDIAGCAPLEVMFTDTSKLSFGTITSWNWSFGTGTTSTTPNMASYTYEDEGTYEVLLKVTADNGCSDTASFRSIEVNPTPAADFSFVDTADVTVDFTDLSNGATSWLWTFGDPTTGSNDTSIIQNPSHIYSAASLSSLVNVCLIATNSFGCADTICKQITVTGLNDENYFSKIKVYPNPATDGVITIDAANVKTQNLQIWIFNVLGEEVKFTTDVNSSLIKVSTIDKKAGIYFLKLNSDNLSQTRKIVIQ